MPYVNYLYIVTYILTGFVRTPFRLRKILKILLPCYLHWIWKVLHPRPYFPSDYHLFRSMIDDIVLAEVHFLFESLNPSYSWVTFCGVGIPKSAYVNFVWFCMSFRVSFTSVGTWVHIRLRLVNQPLKRSIHNLLLIGIHRNTLYLDNPVTAKPTPIEVTLRSWFVLSFHHSYPYIRFGSVRNGQGTTVLHC